MTHKLSAIIVCGFIVMFMFVMVIRDCADWSIKPSRFKERWFVGCADPHDTRSDVYDKCGMPDIMIHYDSGNWKEFRYQRPGLSMIIQFDEPGSVTSIQEKR
jgi:hypothetical protein